MDLEKNRKRLSCSVLNFLSSKQESILFAEEVYYCV